MKDEGTAAEQQYADIINLPHHVSTRHPQMPMWSRAAQFAPFAALNGYDDAVKASAEKKEREYDSGGRLTQMDVDGDADLDAEIPAHR